MISSGSGFSFAGNSSRDSPSFACLFYEFSVEISLLFVPFFHCISTQFYVFVSGRTLSKAHGIGTQSDLAMSCRSWEM
jgi:hypothetical protein